MLGDNGVEMSFIFPRILGPLVFGWAPDHLVLGAHLCSWRIKVSLYPWGMTNIVPKGMVGRIYEGRL